MAKRELQPRPLLYPVPLVLVTCLDEQGEANIITLAWVGTVCSTPPQVGIAVRPGRYSHAAIQQTEEFVINIPNRELLDAVDYCGRVSRRREGDKFAALGLTPLPASRVSAPLIGECPVNLECKLTQSLPLGSHDLFIGEVVAVHVDEGLLDEQGFIDYSKAEAIAYLGNEYWSLGKRLGSVGHVRRSPSVEHLG